MSCFVYRSVITNNNMPVLLVLFSAPRGFSPGTPVFPSPQKPTLSKFQFDPDTVDDKSHYVDVHC